MPSYVVKRLKGIVHFEFNYWYVLAYLIQDVGVLFSAVVSI